jgi:glycosyltransferase involved in cell wall biosynthesis
VAAGVASERVFIAPNAVETPLRRLPRRSLAGRRPLRLIFAGRLQGRKGVANLLEACASLSPQPELWIVGDGPDRERLVSIAARRCPTAVFTGAVHGSDLRRLLEAADVFVLPGTGGLAVQQALAHGLPVIAAQGDGSQEDMVTPDNGWLVGPGAQALAQALHAAWEARRRLPAMGGASLQLAQQRFSPDVMVDVFVGALRGRGEA